MLKYASASTKLFPNNPRARKKATKMYVWSSYSSKIYAAARAVQLLIGS